MNHNQENPVTFAQAKELLNCSSYYLTALKKRLGIRARLFMLSPIRDYLLEHPDFTTSDVYKRSDRSRLLRISKEGNRWVVTMAHNPDVMAEDKSLCKALTTVCHQIEQVMTHKAA